MHVNAAQFVLALGGLFLGMAECAAMGLLTIIAARMEKRRFLTGLAVLIIFAVALKLQPRD